MQNKFCPTKKCHLFALANNGNNIHCNKTINIEARHEFKTSLPASGFIFATLHLHIQLNKKNSMVTHAKTMNFQSAKAIMRFLTLIALRFCNKHPYFNVCCVLSVCFARMLLSCFSLIQGIPLFNLIY